MRVTTDGKNLVSHAGTALLSELADRSGLTNAMSGAMADCGINWQPTIHKNQTNESPENSGRFKEVCCAADGVDELQEESSAATPKNGPAKRRVCRKIIRSVLPIGRPQSLFDRRAPYVPVSHGR